MKAKKKPKGTEAVGVRVKQDKTLDKLTNRVLFPAKLKEANEVVAKLKWQPK